MAESVFNNLFCIHRSIITLFLLVENSYTPFLDFGVCYNINMENKNIFILAAVVLLVVLGTAGYYYWKNYLAPASEESALNGVNEAAQTLTDSASKGVLPDMDASAASDAAANAITDTNPFSDMKTNPFQ